MKTAVFILCLAFTSTAHSGKCQKLAHTILFPLELALNAQLTGRLMLMPQRELYTRTGVEVVGSLISSRKTGEQIAQNLVDFDQSMKSLGLKIPPLTKVIVSDRTLLPHFFGPVQKTANIFNLWHTSEADNIILMQPFLYFRQIVTDPMLLFHERVHSILGGMYRRDSYIFNRPLQEAWADFLPSHHTGNPIINLLMDINRNIDEAPSLTLLTSIDPHETGRKFSYTLWKLRERMGKEKINALLKPFIDDLNQYHESFEKQRSSNKFRSPQYEYFMAVLKKTLQEKGKTQEADEFISEITTELGLDIAVVDELAESITKSDKNFYNTSTDKRATSPLLYFLGTAAIAIEGYVLYALFF